MVDRVHFIFVLEQVILVHIFDLELVVLSSACFDAVAVIKDLKCMLSRLVTA